MEFEIEVTETLSRVVKVSASNVIDAIIAAESQYKTGALVLDADDFVDVEFICPAEHTGKTAKKQVAISAKKLTQRKDLYEPAV